MIVLLRICWCVNKHLYKLKRRSVQCFLQWFWVSYVKLSIALKLDTDIMYVTDEAGDILRISSINKSHEKAKTHNVLIRLSTFFYFLVCDSWLQLQWSVFSYKEGHKLIIIRSLQLLDLSVVLKRSPLRRSRTCSRSWTIIHFLSAIPDEY